LLSVTPSHGLERIDSRLPAGASSPVVNEQQFQRVLAELGSALARMALGYERDPERRRDLLQEIHLAVWRSLELFDSRCSLRTWVYRVAHNTAVKHVLREKRGGFAALKNLDDVDEPSHPADLEHEVQRASAADRLGVLITKLKPLDRQVILLFLEDVDSVEIAAITGLSHNAVRVRVHRIKQVLRGLFGERSNDV
jgi:RNA polymerase sigma-70 factor (ECF subfamily)